MEISENARQLMEEKNISMSGVDTVESYCDKREQVIVDPVKNVHYMHAQVGRNTIWLQYRETDGKRELLDIYAHRVTLRDEIIGEPQFQEGPTPTQTYCKRCNAALETIMTNMNYLSYPFKKELPRCPICGQLFISPEFMRERVAPMEKGLEHK